MPALGGAAGLDLAELLATPVTGRTVGFQPSSATTVGAIGAQGWRREDLPLPSVILRDSAIAHNVALMARYCARERVDIAPHGKTTMAPQLWSRQLEAGAWGLTAATAGQADSMLRVGAPHVLLANELVDEASVRSMASSLGEHDGSVACWVDSTDGVGRLGDGLRRAASPRPIDVFVEVGHAGGRTGCRTVADALDVARAAAAADGLRLVGVSGYEGTIGHDRSTETLDAVDRFLLQLRAVAERAIAEDLFDDEVVVSAGGSLFFDRVVEVLRDGWGAVAKVRVLLRSGCTITHDHGMYERGSPFGASPPEGRFHPAFEARGAVLSRPEPTVAVVGLGKRDVPSDVDPPIPLATGAGADVRGRMAVARLMDHHAICDFAPDLALRAGDEVVFGISHQCTAFDRRRVIPLLDDDDRVVSAVATWF